MASGKSIDLQLNINTAFKNVDQAISAFKAKISQIDLSGNLSKDLVANFQGQAEKIQETLSEVKGFDFQTGSVKEYTTLINTLKNQYAELKSMAKQYSDTFITTSEQNIEKQKNIIAGIDEEIAARKKQNQDLEKGREIYESNNNSLEGLKTKERELAETYANNVSAISENEAALKKLGNQRAGHLGAITKEKKSLEEHIQVLEEEEKINKSLGIETESVINARKEDASAAKEQEEANKKAQKAAEAALKTEEKEAKVKNELQKVSATFVQELTNQASATDKLTASLEKSIVKWTSLTTVVGVAKRAISDIISTYQQLDDNLSAISAVSGISSQELWGDMPGMIDDANKLALSIDDVTDGMLSLYQQGLDTVEVELRLEAAGKLAAISQQSLETSVDQLTAVMNTFGLEGEEANKVIDIMAAQSANSAISVAELGTALSPVASLAASAGMSLESTTAFITTMESTTRQSASIIGNALKTIIARFQQLKESSDSLLEDGTSANDVEEALKTANVELRDAEGNFRDFDDVILELSQKWDTLDSNTQRYIATVGAGTRQQSQFIALVSNYSKTIENIETATNSAGAAEVQFQAISTNLSSALNRLENNFTALKTSWTSGINVITLVVDAFAGLIGVISKIPTGISAAVVAFTALIARQVALELQSKKNVIQMAKETAAREINDKIMNSSATSTEKLAALKEILAVKSKKLTAEQLAQCLTLEGLSDEEKKEIISNTLLATSNEGLTFSFELLGDSIKTAAAKLWAFVSNPYVIAVVAIVGSIAALTAGFIYLSNAEERAIEKTAEERQELEDSSAELLQQAQECLELADAVASYTEQLENAHDAGEDLTDLRKEIASAYSEEEIGVDALTASYQELVKALKEYEEQKRLEAAQDTVGIINNRRTDNNISAEAYQNYGKKGATATNKETGETLTLKDTDIAGFYSNTYTVDWDIEWTVTIGEDTYTFDTQEDRDSFVEKLINGDAPISMTLSEARDVTTVLEQDADISGQLILSGENLASAIQYYSTNVGDYFDAAANTLTEGFQEYEASYAAASQAAQNQVNMTSQQFNQALRGDFGDLNDAQVQFMLDFDTTSEKALNAFSSSFLEQIEKSKDTITNGLNEIKERFTGGDYEIIDEEAAKNISNSGWLLIEDAFDAGGADFAEVIAEILSDNFGDGVENADLQDKLNDILSDIDFSSIDSLNEAQDQVQELINTLSGSEIDVSWLENFLSYLQAAEGQLVDFNTTATDFYNSFQSYDDVMTTLAEAVNGQVISMEDLNQVMEYTGLSFQELQQYLTVTADGYYLNAEGAELCANATNEKASADYDETIATANASIALAEQNKAHLANAKAALLNAKATAELGTVEVDSLSPTQYMAQNINYAASEMAQLKNVTDGTSISVTDFSDKAVTIGDNMRQAAIEIQSMINEVDAQTASQDDAIASAKNLIATALQQKSTLGSGADALNNYSNALNGGSGGSGGSGSGGAAGAADDLTDAIEAQKEALEAEIEVLEDQKDALNDEKSALQEQKEALEEVNKKLQEQLKLYIQLIQSRLTDEIERQTQTVEAFYEAIKDSIEAEIDAFNDKLDQLEKRANELQDEADELQDAADEQEDSLNKLYDAAQAYYDTVQEGIDSEIELQDQAIERNQVKITLLQEQKDAIQDQIDALDDAADSESKLLALEKARNELENARNQKTRLVLTEGGGWRFKTDKSAVESAQSNLASAELDYQKELLEREQDKLDTQISELEAQNDNLESIKDTLESQKDTIDDIKQQWDDVADALGKTTSEIQEQTDLLKLFVENNDTGRQDLLSNFAADVGQNNISQQLAADASNQAQQAQDEYDTQNDADQEGSIAAAIESLKQQQNQADEAQKTYFENLLSNNAQQIAIEQQMQGLVDQIVGSTQGQLDSFTVYQELINEAINQANEQAVTYADYINRINDAIDFYSEWSNNVGLTSEQIRENAAITSEVNTATLDSLLEGGTTFSQLQSQYEEIIRNNDEAEAIQDQIDAIDAQIDVVQDQIDALKNQESALSASQEQNDNTNTGKITNAATGAGKTVASGISSASQISSKDSNEIKQAIIQHHSGEIAMLTTLYGKLSAISDTVKSINGKDWTHPVFLSFSLPSSSQSDAEGGTVGFSQGGVDDFTKTVAIHGTKNRPELVLNNSQSAALFKYIDSMTRIPTLSTAGSARNALQSFGTTNNTTDNGTSFTGCEFNIQSNADNLDSLVQELKQSVSIRN